MSDAVMVPISVGELFDKITILEIKSERIKDEGKLANVNEELRLLRGIATSLHVPNRAASAAIVHRLRVVNERIWDAEDRIREHERQHLFDGSFLDVARSIYRLNDARAAAKRELNILIPTGIVEEKSYSGY